MNSKEKSCNQRQNSDLIIGNINEKSWKIVQKKIEEIKFHACGLVWTLIRKKIMWFVILSIGEWKTFYTWKGFLDKNIIITCCRTSSRLRITSLSLYFKYSKLTKNKRNFITLSLSVHLPEITKLARSRAHVLHQFIENSDPQSSSDSVELIPIFL